MVEPWGLSQDERQALGHVSAMRQGFAIAPGRAAIRIGETEATLRNKIGRGSFNGASVIQCLVAIGATSLRE